MFHVYEDREGVELDLPYTEDYSHPRSHRLSDTKDSARCGSTVLQLLIKLSQRPLKQYMQAAVTTLDRSPQLDGKTLLWKMPHIRVIGPGETKLALNRKLSPY